ncbi:hypothetical protein M0R45_004787 [Rubus argutus]|uniref:Uncharacterized protein n=1 Tax=Rubus argutus TaxID=59490 RepID=A0AAW1YKY6_RUBAR
MPEEPSQLLSMFFQTESELIGNVTARVAANLVLFPTRPSNHDAYRNDNSADLGQLGELFIELRDMAVGCLLGDDNDREVQIGIERKGLASYSLFFFFLTKRRNKIYRLDHF